MSDSPFAEFAAGAAIVREGEPARAMYIVESGRVEIRSSSSPLPLAELGPGEVIGEMALLQEQPHSATATARTAVRALCIDQAAFHAVLRENPEVAIQLMRQLVLRLRAAEQRGAGVAASAARAPAAAAAPAPAAPAPAAGAATPVPASAGPAPKPAPDRAAAPPRSAVDTALPPSAPPAAPPAKPPAPAAPPASSSPPKQPPPPAPPAAAGAAPAAAAAPAATAPAAVPPPAPAARWCIRHAQGEISLAPQREEWLIGRPDPATGQVPEIDLGGLDVARSLSRRHARLRREGAQLVLREEPGVANGTWVNGERLAAGAAAPLRPGDRLRFGAVEVEFVAG